MKKLKAKPLGAKLFNLFKTNILPLLNTIDLPSNMSFRRNPFKIQDYTLKQKRSRRGGMTFLINPLANLSFKMVSRFSGLSETSQS